MLRFCFPFAPSLAIFWAINVTLAPVALGTPFGVIFCLRFYHRCVVAFESCPDQSILSRLLFVRAHTIFAGFT